jgi:raffinose/stachyose/melibiose transport system permease protein/N-acetylglucosamine transport system permease protein
MKEEVINKVSLKDRIRSRWNSFTIQEKVLLTIFHIILLVMSIWVLLPIYFLLLNAIKDVVEYNVSAVSLPTHIHIDNFKLAFSMSYRNTNILGMALNSIIYVVTYSTGSIMSSCMVAYALTRYKFKGRKILTVFALVVQMIPIYGTETAAYQLLYNLGMIDNLATIWISGASGFTYTYLIAASYFSIVSWEYAEAAFIDGAGNWYVFLRIMMPMILPSILVLWLNNVIALWNDYMSPTLYLPNYPTLSSGIFNLKSMAAFIEGGMTTYFASMVIAFIPVSIVFLWLQKKILNIKLEGGIKG